MDNPAEIIGARSALTVRDIEAIRDRIGGGCEVTAAVIGNGRTTIEVADWNGTAHRRWDFDHRGQPRVKATPKRVIKAVAAAFAEVGC